MNKYLKDNLILGDWLENFFGSITLPWVVQIFAGSVAAKVKPGLFIKFPNNIPDTSYNLE